VARGVRSSNKVLEAFGPSAPGSVSTAERCSPLALDHLQVSRGLWLLLALIEFWLGPCPMRDRHICCLSQCRGAY
jgi:hypothetical protein